MFFARARQPDRNVEALRALEADNAFLQEGGLLTHDLFDTWIDFKHEKELLPFAQRPHPFEYELYFGV